MCRRLLSAACLAFCGNDLLEERACVQLLLRGVAAESPRAQRWLLPVFVRPLFVTQLTLFFEHSTVVAALAASFVRLVLHAVESTAVCLVVDRPWEV